jgi:hypothetical protein
MDVREHLIIDQSIGIITTGKTLVYLFLMLFYSSFQSAGNPDIENSSKTGGHIDVVLSHRIGRKNSELGTGAEILQPADGFQDDRKRRWNLFGIEKFLRGLLMSYGGYDKISAAGHGLPGGSPAVPR